MTSFITITDLHLQQDNLDIMNDLIDQVIHICHDKGVDTVFIIGDIFQFRRSQSLPVLLGFVDIIGKFSEAGITVHAIAGNHDKLDQSSIRSYLTLYQQRNNFILSEDYNTVEVGDTMIHLIPFFPIDIYEKCLSEISNIISDYGYKKNILMTHVDILNADMNNGKKSDTGIDMELLKVFDHVFVGHYHNRSRIGNNVHYIGSMKQSNYGEDDQKGCMFYKDSKIEYINLKFPKFRTIIVNADSLDMKKFDELYDECKVEKESGKHIRLVIKGEEANVDAIYHNLWL